MPALTKQSKDAQVPLDTMSLDALAEMANEAAEACEKHARNTVTAAAAAGEALLAAKAQVAHGQWLTWLGSNFLYSQQTASEYMSIAHYRRAGNLKDASSIREALRLIGEDKGDAKRKAPAKFEAAPVDDLDQGSNYGHARNLEDAPAGAAGPSKASETGSLGKCDITEREKPQTADDSGRSTPAASPSRQQAKPAKKTVQAELVTPAAKADPVRQWLSTHSLAEIIHEVISELQDAKARQKAAAQLRKLADELDPPAKFRPPTVDEVDAYCRERQNTIDAEEFHAHYEKIGWKDTHGKKLTNWRAAVITWEKQHRRKASPATATHPPARRRNIVYQEASLE